MPNLRQQLDLLRFALKGQRYYQPLHDKKFPCKKKTIFIILAAIIIIAVAIFLGLWFGLATEHEDSAAVVANGLECAKIGTDILKQGGSVADAAIAVLLCEGVTCPQSTGLGGGFLLTIFTKATGKVETLIAREMAPLDATWDMYNNTQLMRGPLVVAVPGELKGYAALHGKYGSLSWKTILQPTIDLCLNGHLVTPYLGRILKSREDIILGSPSLREVFINPQTNQTWVEGDILRRIKLGESLQIIAEEGANAIYNNGSLTQKLVNDIRENGGIIRVEDFLNYEIRWEEPEVVNLINDKTLYTVPLPGTGILLAFILNVLNGEIDTENVEAYQKIVETFKYAFAYRSSLADAHFVPEIQSLISNLTDPLYADYIRSILLTDSTSQDPRYYGADFISPEDQGTAHSSVIAPNGDAIAVTGTINTLFGSKFRSSSTGIILNDEMDDFSLPTRTNAYGVPPSPNNYIVPGKRPLSSMCPTIIVNGDGNAELVIGAAGGTRITTSVAYIIIRNLWFHENLVKSMDAYRIHHQLMPMELHREHGFNDEISAALEAIGHVVIQAAEDEGFASVTAIAREGKKLSAVFDRRRGGSVSVY